VAVVNAYMGEDLPIRHSYVLDFLYDPGSNNNFIIPYPGTVPESPSRPVPLFEVYTLQKPAGLDAAGPIFSKEPEWEEPAFVHVERGLLALRKTPRPWVLNGSISPDCDRSSERWVSCAAELIVQAVRIRVDPSARRGLLPLALGRQRRLERAMAERLKEYEANRKQYPKLTQFYPRLFDVLRR
jgi:hypothetical protein